MTSESKAVLIFDNLSKEGKIWSHHVLRVLFSVHYKGIPYSFKAIEYPDIVSTFAPTSLEPKDDPIEPYEIPVLQFQTSSGSVGYEMNVPKIIQALEHLKSEPCLRFDSPRSVEYRARFGPAFVPIIQLTVGHVPRILSERSAVAFYEKRRLRWGKSVEQWIEDHPIQEGLSVAEPRLRELGDWLDAVPGPFVDGDSPGYADFTIASLLAFVKAVGLSDVFERVLGFHAAIRRLYDAVGLTQVGNDWCQYLFEESK
ncbi:hypothetical protein FP744_10006398 [Trichoderma asperellum]|nr:hypothetical protein LI328DRAFT_166949 [Trichoderma asperelloides]